MCLHPELIPPIPEAAAKVAKAAFPKGNRYMRLRDELGVFYHDEEFAELYPERGQERDRTLAINDIIFYFGGTNALISIFSYNLVRER